jgi:hypothetical protein
MQIRRFKLFAGIAMVTFTVGGAAHAGPTNLSCHSSGSSISVPIDVDGDSCFIASNSHLICTDTSGYGNFGFKCSPGGPAGTGTNIFEYDPVPGTGCVFDPAHIESCTLAGTSEQGCLFQSVGGTEVDRDGSTGDLLFSTATATDCIDFSSGPPFNLAGSSNGTITGGTGKNAGATGTSTGTFHGQLMTLDPAGHGIAWFEGDSTETITTK